MTDRRNQFYAVALVLVCIGLFFVLFEHYEEETDVGWGSEALRNPFLAAQLITEQNGGQVESADSFLKLSELNKFDTLFLSQSGQILSQERLEEILDWLESGGNLVVAAQNKVDWEHDRLFEHFAISTQKTEFKASVFDEDFFQDFSEDATPDENSGADSDETRDSSGDEGGDEGGEESQKIDVGDALRRLNEEMAKQAAQRDAEQNKTYREQVRAYEKEVPAEELTLLAFEGLDGDVVAHINPSLALQHPAIEENADLDDYSLNYVRGTEYGKHFLQLQVGSGVMTVLSSSDLFRSGNIAKFDHARLWTVLTGDGQLGILYGSNMPSLWSMLTHYMPEFLYASAALIVLWIWYSTRRFGPLRETRFTVRRSFLEHVSAAAGYLWRGKWQQQLLHPVQLEINKLAESRLTGYAEAAPDKKQQMLAQASQLSADVVAAAMQSAQSLNEDSFYKTVQILQRIRESL